MDEVRVSLNSLALFGSELPTHVQEHFPPTPQLLANPIINTNPHVHHRDTSTLHAQNTTARVSANSNPQCHQAASHLAPSLT